MKIYLASKYARRDEMRALRDRLQAEAPHLTVNSRWLDWHTWDMPYEPYESVEEKASLEDLEDIANCEIVIHHTEAPGEYTTGGRHVEFGAAYIMGKLNVIVGPKENVFHSLPGVIQLDNDDQLIEAAKCWEQKVGKA